MAFSGYRRFFEIRRNISMLHTSLHSLLILTHIQETEETPGERVSQTNITGTNVRIDNFRRFEIRVEARNRKASQDLKDKFKRHPKGPLLNVFCVRNEEYDKHLTGYNVSDPPRLTLEATGIPALTRFIMSLPGTGRWNVLDAHIRKDMYITFQTLELYGNSAPSQYKGEVAEICADFSKSAPDKARKFYKTFQQKQMSIVKQELAKGLDSWVLKAGNICDNWKSNINSRSYGVIIKKNGVHNSRKAGDINWNNDLLGPVRPYIDQILNKLQSEIARTLPVEIGKILSGLIENLEQKLLNDPAASIAGVKEEFIASLPLRGEEMERKCHEACEKLAKKLRTVHDDAVTLGDKSYFPPTMAGAYDAAKQAKQSGRTSIHAARCAAFKEAVQSRNGPFYALKKRLERECNKVLEEGHIDILHSVHEIFKAIEFDANNACPDGSPDMDPKAQEFNNNLLSLVAETKKEVKNEIIPCLGEAIHYGLESQNN